MKKYDAVQLINDNDSLFEKGIKKGCIGVFLEYSQNYGCMVLFFNLRNIGEYAVGMAEETNLKLLGEIPGEYKADIEKQLKNPHFLEKIQFSQSVVKEYDLVELIIDRLEYSKYGVFKGMRGCVMSNCAYKGKWQVIFSEEGTGRDIADIQVREEDFKIIN